MTHYSPSFRLGDLPKTRQGHLSSGVTSIGIVPAAGNHVKVRE